MDSINRRSPSLYESGASTSIASPEPASPGSHHTPRSCIPRKRKNHSSVGHDQTSSERKPVKKRKIQLVKQTNVSGEDKRCTKVACTKESQKAKATAKHRLQEKTLRYEKMDAMKEVEQWLNARGVNTESLKQGNTATDKLTQYEKKLQNYKEKDNNIIQLCQGALDELAKIFIDFKIVSKIEPIEHLNQLIAKTERLKKLIPVDKTVYTQFISLRKKIIKRSCEADRQERKRHYANALYCEAKSLMTHSLPENEYNKINESINLLSRVAGINSEPIKKNRVNSNSWNNEKNKKTKTAISRLENILKEKYNVTTIKNSKSNLVQMAIESVQIIKKYRKLPTKEYTYSDFKIFDKRSNKSEIRTKSNAEFNKEHRDKINHQLIELQKNLGISYNNKRNNIDIEKTILATCDFLEKFEPDSQATSSTQNTDNEEFDTQIKKKRKKQNLRNKEKTEETILEARDFSDEYKPDSDFFTSIQEVDEEGIDEEGIAAESTSATTSSCSEPLFFESKESACSSKNIHSIRKELAYAVLKETLTKWPAISPLPSDDRELICAAAYCTNSIYRKEPITYVAYQQFRSSQLTSNRHNDTPEESINTQLNSLKKQLIDASLPTEEMDKKQGIEIIRAANEYLNLNA